MITERELKNLEQNFKAQIRHILTPEAHDIWGPIILELIEQARLAPGALAAQAGKGREVMSTMEEKVTYLGVKIGELRDCLDNLENWRKLHDADITKLEKQNAALAHRIAKLELQRAHEVDSDLAALAARLNALATRAEGGEAEAVSEAHCERVITPSEWDALTARLNALERKIENQREGFVDRIDALAERVAALEKPAEWVKGNGLLPDNTYDLTEKEG